MSLYIEDIKEAVYSSGFDAAGVVSVSQDMHDERWLRCCQAYLRWCDSGCAAGMEYMTRQPSRRTDLFKSVPWAKTMIIVAASYYNKRDEQDVRNDGQGMVARYAWGQDYHHVLKEKLFVLANRLLKMSGREIRYKTSVDTGAYLERALAEMTGIGFFGKNTNLIIPGVGSYVFLGVLVTDFEIDEVPSAVIANPPVVIASVAKQSQATVTPEIATPLKAPRNDDSECGSCRLCLDACPTGALTEPYRLDARKCISYLTIENRGPIPDDVAEKVGQSVFGCDRCQEACPHNKQAKVSSWKEFKPESGVGPVLSLMEIMAIVDEKEFNSRFAGTPLLRAGLAGLKRNAETVMRGREIASLRSQ